MFSFQLSKEFEKIDSKSNINNKQRFKSDDATSNTLSDNDTENIEKIEKVDKIDNLVKSEKIENFDKFENKIIKQHSRNYDITINNNLNFITNNNVSNVNNVNTVNNENNIDNRNTHTNEKFYKTITNNMNTNNKMTKHTNSYGNVLNSVMKSFQSDLKIKEMVNIVSSNSNKILDYNVLCKNILINILNI